MTQHQELIPILSRGKMDEFNISKALTRLDWIKTKKHTKVGRVHLFNNEI